MGRNSSDRGGARRGRPSLQFTGRAVHGALRPGRLELSARDRVALANYTEIAEGRGTEHGGVFLDISHRDKSYILEKLPRMYRQFLEAQMLDISREPMEVAPTAHYSMGGVVVEPETHATDVEGLYAAGETTTGLHGANRLGGNSLSETVIFGRRAGEAAAAFSHVLRRATALQAEDRRGRRGAEQPHPRGRGVRQAPAKGPAQHHVGVLRRRAQRGEANRRAEEAQGDTGAAGDVDVRPTSEGYADLAHALDLRASLVSAEASLLGAVERRESRGAHNRSDHPELDPRLRKNFVITRNDEGNLAVSSQPVDEVPGDLKEWVRDDGEVDIASRLLE